MPNSSPPSTLSGSFSLEFDPIDVARQSNVGLMQTSPNSSPYLLRLLGTKNFFPEEAELEYQCFQTPVNNHASMVLGRESTSPDDQRDEWRGYHHIQREHATREDPNYDEIIHGRRVLSPKNSAVFEEYPELHLYCLMNSKPNDGSIKTKRQDIINGMRNIKFVPLTTTLFTGSRALQQKYERAVKEYQ